MSIILIIVANLEKLHVRLMRFCMTMRRKFAVRVTQICVLMAYALHRNTLGESSVYISTVISGLTHLVNHL